MDYLIGEAQAVTMQMRVGFVAGGSLALAASFSGCERPPNPAVEPASSAPSAAVSATAPVSSFVAVRDAAADVASPPQEAPTVTSDPKRFGCGDGACRVGAETCCAAGKNSVCLPTTPNDGPQGSIGYLKSQWEACDKAMRERSTSLERIDRCDESVDCASAQLCCSQFLFSGGEMGECTPQAKSGLTPCDFGERCVEGSPCRLPGTVCIQGTCKKPRNQLVCGNAPCPIETPICCGEPFGCATQTECPHYRHIECLRNTDCIPGERCAHSQRSTTCLRITPDPEHTGYVCERNADCPNKCSARGARPRCVQSELAFIKYCECPA